MTDRNPARDLVLGIETYPLMTPSRGARIRVRFEPEPGDPEEAATVELTGRLVEVTAAGLWWAPDYDGTFELVPWRLIRIVETDREADE